MIQNLTYAKLFSAFILWFFTLQVDAQKFSLGVRGGASVTWAGFGDKEAKQQFSRGIKQGYQGAVFISFPMKKNYDLFIEAGASQKGRVIKFNGGDWKNNLTLYTADMGMQLRRSFKFTLKKNTPSDVFVGLGPEISYWLSSKGFLKVGDGPKYKYDGLFEDQEPSGDGYTLRMREINRWLFSLGLTFGVKMPLQRGNHITTEFRFMSGHTFLGKATSTGPESGPGNIIWGDGNMQDTMKTNLKTFSVNLAYTFDFDVKEGRKGKSNIKKRLKKT
jgi:hypothetical protein